MKNAVVSDDFCLETENYCERSDADDGVSGTSVHSCHHYDGNESDDDGLYHSNSDKKSDGNFLSGMPADFLNGKNLERMFCREYGNQKDLPNYGFVGIWTGLKNFVWKAGGLYRDHHDHGHWPGNFHDRERKKVVLPKVLNWRRVFVCQA